MMGVFVFRIDKNMSMSNREKAIRLELLSIWIIIWFCGLLWEGKRMDFWLEMQKYHPLYWKWIFSHILNYTGKATKYDSTIEMILHTLQSMIFTYIIIFCSLYDINNKMKTAPHIRIVYLKNQKSPYKQHHQSSFIVPPLES